MSAAGWYPDPGGQPGLFRYWTGTAWTSAVTTNPAGTQPPAGASAPTSPTSTPRRRVGAGVWLGGIAGVLILGLIVWLVFQGVGQLSGGRGSDRPPPGAPSQNACPIVGANATPSAVNTDPNRVAAGKLSFPLLGSP